MVFLAFPFPLVSTFDRHSCLKSKHKIEITHLDFYKYFQNNSGGNKIKYVSLTG